MKNLSLLIEFCGRNRFWVVKRQMNAEAFCPGHWIYIHHEDFLTTCLFFQANRVGKGALSPCLESIGRQ